MTRILDYDIVGLEFELLLRFCDYFRTNTLWESMKPFIPSAIGLKVQLVSFYKDGFEIKCPTNIYVIK